MTATDRAPSPAGATSGTPVVELADITKTYPGEPPVYAVRECDLRIDTGDYIAVMGPSGSGKSTLLNLLGLLDEPTSGSYHLEGDLVSGLSERQRCGIRAHRIGFVFQSFHLVNYRTAVENVATGLLYQHTRPKDRRDAAIEVLEQIGLERRMWATPAEMSGGERQRVAIARALVRRPAIVLCDEPTGNLDSATGEQVLALLDQLHDDGMTIVVITHDPTVALRARHRVELRDGVVIAAGSTPSG